MGFGIAMPQLRGLGSGSMATFYGLGSAQEAEAYLAHPVLGPRSKQCVAAMNPWGGTDAVEVLGQIDAAKFRSCLTFLGAIDPADRTFREALRIFFPARPTQERLRCSRRYGTSPDEASSWPCGDVSARRVRRASRFGPIILSSREMPLAIPKASPSVTAWT
jgi:uncharacterized protein (DUF1810 family)